MQENRLQIIFSRQQSSYIKGVAIILLILHHLFLFPTSNPWFTSVVGNSWGGIEFFFSSIGKLCIPLFFFVSGYGLWHSSSPDPNPWKSTVRRLMYIYTVYMITVAVTVLILSLSGGSLVLHSLRETVYTFLGIDVSLNGSWWFFIIYVELLLLVPLATGVARRFSWQLLLLLSTLLYLFSHESGFPYFVRVLSGTKLGDFAYHFFPVSRFWLNQAYFFTGFCLAASGLFESALQQALSRLHQNGLRYPVALMVLAFLLMFRFLLVDIADAVGLVAKSELDIFSYTTISLRADFILAPICIFALILLFHGQRLPVLRFLGDQSAAIWLIHGTVIYLVVAAVKPYHPWSVFVFVIVLFFSVLYARIVDVCRRALSREKKV